MDFTQSLEKKAQANMREKQSRSQRFFGLVASCPFFPKIRSDLKRLPNPSDPLVRNQ